MSNQPVFNLWPALTLTLFIVVMIPIALFANWVSIDFGLGFMVGVAYMWWAARIDRKDREDASNHRRIRALTRASPVCPLALHLRCLRRLTQDADACAKSFCGMGKLASGPPDRAIADACLAAPRVMAPEAASRPHPEPQTPHQRRGCRLHHLHRY